MAAARLVPVILAGGAGTRLWPLSRRSMPKQFLPLLGSRSTYQETLARIADPALFATPLVITNADFRFFARRQAEEIGVAVEVVLEPALRDSAAAIAAATCLVAQDNPEAVILTLAADHVIDDAQAFRRDCALALSLAQQSRIVTFGITPTRPETGYGYITRGAPVAESASAVAAFREKPDVATATALIAAGGLWNSGNFAFPAALMLAELEQHAPQVLAAARAAVTAATIDLGFTRLDADAFSRAPRLSIDHGVMEHTAHAAVIAASYGWSDVGNWDAVHAASPRDARGNVTVGPASLRKTRNSYVRSDGPLTTVIGLDDVMVVATEDAVLVASRQASAEVKDLVGALEQAGERAVREHRQSHRPWGWYQEVDRGERFRVKRIVVEPGQRLSLQKHHHRAEHWIVVRGTAEITVGETVRLVNENESIFIPVGEQHRLANPGRIALELIEVQTGSYLEENDIVRLDDDYRRD